MRINFKTSLLAVLKYEGGYSNHPLDPGGATMKGVTQRVYDAWRKKNDLSTRPVKNIDDSEIEAIYKRDYWDAVNGDDLPSGVDLAVFDYAVNSGVSRAVSQLQDCLGVDRTGKMNATTIEAAKRNPDVWSCVCDKRLSFLKRLKTWPTFGKGWGSRVIDVKRKSAALASQTNIVSNGAQYIDVVGAQKKLRDLNYALGAADGKIGPLTRSAIRDFQDDNNLPITGELDNATLNALSSSNARPRPVSIDRKNVTAKDLREAGSEIADGTYKAKLGIASAGLAAAANTVSETKEMASQVKDIAEGVKSGAGVLEVVKDYWFVIFTIVSTILIIYFLWKAYKAAQFAEEARVKNARSGANVRI